MAAEAPDLHQGDLGRLEEVRIALIGADIIGHKESTNKNCLIALLKVLKERVGDISCFNKYTAKLFSTAIECIVRKVIAYVGHPVDLYAEQLSTKRWEFLYFPS